MVTKFRSFRTNTAVKTIAFILNVLLITAVIVQLAYVAYKDVEPECLFVKEYENSENYQDSFYNAIQNIFTQRAILSNPTIAMDTLSNPTENESYYYYISDGKNEYSNVGETERTYYEQYTDHFYAYEDGRWSYGKGTDYAFIFSNSKNFYFNENDTVYLAFPDELMEQKQQDWEADRASVIPILYSVAACTLFSIILTIYSICVTGRRPEDKEVHLSKGDSIYSDILLAVFVTSLGLWVNSVSNVPGYLYYTGYQLYGLLQIVQIGILTVLVSVMCGLILLSMVRKIKAGIFVKNSLIYRGYYHVAAFYRYLFDGRMFDKFPLTKALFYRQLTFIISSVVIVFLTLLLFVAETLLCLIPPLAEIAMIYWYIKGNKLIYEDINKGFDASLEEQMKAERMKVELITNVSHDLKTPLTSIISYVDLLTKEEGLSDTAMDYVKILQDKSERLKSIVTDLFDLAKSSSGDITLELEILDIKKLIEQTLGDMEDNINQSGLNMKTMLPDVPVMIKADGKKLYRVFLNVIDNALKYSMAGTRVFVELMQAGGRAVATIKNIAGYEMDFTAEEVRQRFTRGDKSRTTEGSGLGLSIAESFTKVCGGDFKVEIDGDMFKVLISFNLQQTVKTDK